MDFHLPLGIVLISLSALYCMRQASGPTRVIRHKSLTHNPNNWDNAMCNEGQQTVPHFFFFEMFT